MATIKSNGITLNTVPNDTAKAIEGYNSAGWATITNAASKYVTMWVKKNSNSITVAVNDYDFTNQIHNFDYTGEIQSITVPAGQYVLECWGAGRFGDFLSSPSRIGGGYSKGTLNLNSTTTLYIHVGFAPIETNNRAPSYHDGGPRTYYNTMGCGSTSIRIGTDDVYHRVIVAGGAGGYLQNAFYTGFGGGTNGTDGYGPNYTSPGKGGTQTTRGNGVNFQSGTEEYKTGGFGYNHSALINDDTVTYGGGGWYVGGAGRDSSSTYPYFANAGGGSGWVYTADTYNTFYAGANNYVKQRWALTSTYYLSDASTVAGNQTFKSPSGINEIGHCDDGYVRITAKIRNDYNTTQQFSIGKNTLTPIIVTLPTNKTQRMIKPDSTVYSAFEHTCNSSNSSALSKATKMYYNFTDETDYYLDTNCMKVGNLWYKTDETTWESNIAPLLQKTSNGWTKEVMNVFAYDNGEWKTYHPDPIVITFDINNHIYTDWNNIVMPLNTFQGCSITPPTVTFTDNATGRWNTAADGSGIDVTDGFRPIVDTTVYLIKQ